MKMAARKDEDAMFQKMNKGPWKMVCHGQPEQQLVLSMPASALSTTSAPQKDPKLTGMSVHTSYFNDMCW